MPSSKIHSHSGQTWTRIYVGLSGPVILLFHPLPRKSGASVWDSGTAVPELCAMASVCGTSNTKEIDARTLWRELGLRVLLLGSWGNRKHYRELTVLNVSYPLTHCASSTRRLCLQGFRKAKIQSVLQRYRHLLASLSVSFIPSCNCIYWVPAPWQALLHVQGTLWWTRQRSYQLSWSLHSRTLELRNTGTPLQP